MGSYRDEFHKLSSLWLHELRTFVVSFIQANQKDENRKLDGLISAAMRIGSIILQQEKKHPGEKDTYDPALKLAQSVLFPQQEFNADPFSPQTRQAIINIKTAVINILSDSFRKGFSHCVAEEIRVGIELIEDAFNSYVYNEKHKQTRLKLEFLPNGDYFPFAESNIATHVYSKIQSLRAGQICTQLNENLKQLLVHAATLPPNDERLQLYRECADKLNLLFCGYRQQVLEYPSEFLELELGFTEGCKKCINFVDKEMEAIGQHRTPAWRRFVTGILGVIASICTLGIPLIFSRFRNTFFQTDATNAKNKISNCFSFCQPILISQKV